MHITQTLAMRASALAVGVLLLSSCIGIETRVSFSADGSGKLDLVYAVSRIADELHTDVESALPFPVNEQDFRAAVDGVAGLQLRQYRQELTSEHIIVTASIRFDSVDAIAKLDSFADMEASVIRDGDRTTYRQSIGSGLGQQEPLNDEAQQMVEALFGGYEVVFAVEAPADVVDASGGELSSDGRSVVFSMGLLEWVADGADRVLSATW